MCRGRIGRRWRGWWDELFSRSPVFFFGVEFVEEGFAVDKIPLPGGGETCGQLSFETRIEQLKIVDQLFNLRSE